MVEALESNYGYNVDRVQAMRSQELIEYILAFVTARRPGSVVDNLAGMSSNVRAIIQGKSMP